MRANRQIALQNAGMFHVKHQARKGHRSARGAVPQRTPFLLYRAAAHSNMAHANAARRGAYNGLSSANSRSPHSRNASNTGTKPSPRGVRRYSTRGGTSPKS